MVASRMGNGLLKYRSKHTKPPHPDDDHHGPAGAVPLERTAETRNTIHATVAAVESKNWFSVESVQDARTDKSVAGAYTGPDS